MLHICTVCARKTTLICTILISLFVVFKIVYEESEKSEAESVQVLVYIKAQAFIPNFKMNDFMRLCFEETKVSKIETPSGYDKHRLNDTQIVSKFGRNDIYLSNFFNSNIFSGYFYKFHWSNQ